MSFIDTLIFYGDRHVFNIEVEPPKHWFDEKYISKLNNHRSDSGYCASVMMPIAEEFGDFYCGSTTVTQQVEYLIDGIRKKRYPYTRSSSCFFH